MIPTNIPALSCARQVVKIGIGPDSGHYLPLGDQGILPLERLHYSGT
ncbi:hypothetical protein P0D88_05470 [Paraburkholderia sp. RL18-103-BIB-C]